MKKHLCLFVIPALFMVSCNNGGDNSSVNPSTEHVSEVESLNSTENSSENVSVGTSDEIFSEIESTIVSSEEEVYSSEIENGSEESVYSSEEPTYSSEEPTYSSEEISSDENNSGIIYEENQSDDIGWGNLT